MGCSGCDAAGEGAVGRKKWGALEWALRAQSQVGGNAESGRLIVEKTLPLLRWPVRAEAFADLIPIQRAFTAIHI